MRLVVCMLALAVAPTAGAQQMYKWKDEKGVTHYGEQPGGKAAQKVTLKPGALPADTPQADPDRPVAPQGTPRTNRRNETDLQRQEREFQERQQQRDRALQSDVKRRSEHIAREQRNRQAACDDSQRQLARVKDSWDGQRGYRLNEIRALEETVAKNCR